MGAYLVDNPPRRRQFKARTQRPSGVVVVHTAESTPDWVGHDSGAEAVARFIQGRSDPGSYHDLVDSDSIITLVPYDQQAYHDGTGSNPHSYGVSAATQAAKWNQAPKEWRTKTVRNMARAAAHYSQWRREKYNVPHIPARRVSKAQSSRGVPGFISHGERDPGRRTDPGASFPWELFLDYYKEFTGMVTTGNAVSRGRRALANSIADLRLAITEFDEAKRSRRVVHAQNLVLKSARVTLSRVYAIVPKS